MIFKNKNKDKRSSRSITTGILGLALLLVFLPACSDKITDIETKTTAETYVTLTTTTRGAVNTDGVLWEDRVMPNQLRMIIFDATSGNVVYNDKPLFPNGMDGESEAIKIPGDNPDTKLYDFYFIANETSGGTDFVTALSTITNRSQFTSDSRFWSIPVDPDFKPAQDEPFVMSARYRNIRITRGGTKQSPIPFAIYNNGKMVELVRAFAKVEVTFVNETGKVTANRITSVQLKNIPRFYSVPPLDLFYVSRFPGAANLTTTTELTSFPGFDYSKPVIGVLNFYVPEFLRETTEADTGNTLLSIKGTGFNPYEEPITSSFAGYNQAYMRDLNVATLSSKSILRNMHYKITATITSISDIAVETTVLDWDDADKEYVYVGQNFNLKLQDGTFDTATQNITISTSMPNVTAPHTVELRDAGGSAFFTFTNPTYGTWETRSWTRPAAAAAGDTMFTLWYNGVLVHTFKKQ